MRLPAIVLERFLFMESLLAGVDSAAAAEPVLVVETGGAGAASAASWPMSSACLCSPSTPNPAKFTPAIVTDLIMIWPFLFPILHTLHLPF